VLRREVVRSIARFGGVGVMVGEALAQGQVGVVGMVVEEE
jgi:hypothetical protein